MKPATPLPWPDLTHLADSAEDAAYARHAANVLPVSLDVCNELAAELAACLGLPLSECVGGVFKKYAALAAAEGAQ